MSRDLHQTHQACCFIHMGGHRSHRQITPRRVYYYYYYYYCYYYYYYYYYDY